jgi:GNAT superfamily N-acetyltransferase
MLNVKQFGKYTIEHLGRASDGSHTIQALHEGKPVGELRWSKGYGVDNLDVNPEHRRQGVATAMWTTAIELKKQDKNIPTIKHSRERTAEGDNWAKKTGRYYPPENIINLNNN